MASAAVAIIPVAALQPAIVPRVAVTAVHYGPEPGMHSSPTGILNAPEPDPPGTLVPPVLPLYLDSPGPRDMEFSGFYCETRSKNTFLSPSDGDGSTSGSTHPVDLSWTWSHTTCQSQEY